MSKNRTPSVTEMLQSLDLVFLEDRGKAHRLNIFYLAVNNLIALPILNCFFNKNSFLLNHFLMIHLFKLTAIMIIIFKVSFQGQ